jgi:hypothetical protein
MPAFVKGMFLNILSIQVLLYWFVAVAFLQANSRIVFTQECIISFTLAVVLGKMLTLLLYRLLAKKIKSKSLNIPSQAHQRARYETVPLRRSPSLGPEIA